MYTRFLPGDRCAGHVIVQHLGTGRSAEVYAAQVPSGEMRALKVMFVAGSLSPTRAARFAQEGEALTMIVHPGVVRLYDAGTWGDRLWLSLELAPGETLGQWLRTRGCPPLDDLLHTIQQAGEGLAEAHRVGVVHRDLSPDNLLLLPGGAVKVIDFGMAKLRDWGVKTTEEQQIGSARYQAPEQLRRAPAHPRMDVYALGHVLYEALTGEHAMGGAPRSMYETVRWQIHETPRPLRERMPALPSDLTDLVDRALEKDPGLRLPTMRAFNERLREVRVRLRAPQRRAARNLARVDRDEVQAPTVPMAATPETPPPERAALLPAAPAPVRVAPMQSPAAPALGPAVPTLVSAKPAGFLAKTIPMVAPAPLPALPAELRSTDAPVERTVSRPPAKRRPALPAALLVGAAALVAAGWMRLGPMVFGPQGTTRSRAAAAAPVSASPPASARPALTAAPSASAPRAPGNVPRPPAKGGLAGAGS